VKAGKAGKAGNAGKAVKALPLVCRLSLDYNEKWHLTTKIYLANAFGPPPALLESGETLRNYNCKSCVPRESLPLG